MPTFCQSCGMPLPEQNNDNSQQKYCQYCSDEKGSLNSRESVQAGIAQFLKQF